MLVGCVALRNGCPASVMIQIVSSFKRNVAECCAGWFMADVGMQLNNMFVFKFVACCSVLPKLLHRIRRRH